MNSNNKVKFVETMLNERYLESDVIELRRCHLKFARCSSNFRNLNGERYWHIDSDRISEPKKILII